MRMLIDMVLDQLSQARHLGIEGGDHLVERFADQRLMISLFKAIAFLLAHLKQGLQPAH
jgi:hypothetical protein